MWIVVGYLWLLARLALLICRPKEIVGIAGSVGKSSTRLLLYEVLKDRHKTAMLSGNSETGIALSILGVWPRNYSWADWLRIVVSAPFGIFHLSGKTHVIVEMGTDDIRPPKNMGFLLSIIRPTIALHMNATATHTEQFAAGQKDISERQVLEIIAREDGRIMTESGCRVAIYNGADGAIVQNITRANTQGVEWRSFGPSGDLSLLAHEVTLEGTMFQIQKKNSDDILKLQIANFVLPRMYWENCAAVLLTAQVLKMPEEYVVSRICEHFQLPKSRGSLLHGVRDTVIIDSSYNNSRVPMELYLTMAHTLAQSTFRELIVVMGDMRELGDLTRPEHERIADLLFKIKPRAVYGVGESVGQYVLPRLTASKTMYFADSRKLGEYLNKHVASKAIILVKGSQNTIFLEETVVRLLENPNDREKVCRMDPGWAEIKSRFFNSLPADDVNSQLTK